MKRLLHHLLTATALLLLGPAVATAQGGGTPLNQPATTSYYLTITDPSQVLSVSTGPAGVQVSFATPQLNQIAAGYTITEFDRPYPSSRFLHLRNVWTVTTTGNTAAFCAALQAANPEAFTGSQPKPKNVLCYTPNDYYKGYWSSGYLEFINARTAWNYSHGSPATVVGITDTWFQTLHPDFMGKYVADTAPG
jgi:hypothetical protein